MDYQKQKIFGIGFSKTGTTSLEKAFEILGYNVCRGHWKNSHSNYLMGLYINNDFDEIFRVVNYFDAFADAPWGGGELYKVIYKRLPDSKFILTVRDFDSWYNSFIKMLFKFDDKLSSALDSLHASGRYGGAYFFKHIFQINSLEKNYLKIKQYYENYNKSVEDFFYSNRAEFLILDFTKGDDWVKLCSFLNKPIPSNDFPHKNASKPN